MARLQGNMSVGIFDRDGSIPTKAVLVVRARTSCQKHMVSVAQGSGLISSGAPSLKSPMMVGMSWLELALVAYA